METPREYYRRLSRNWLRLCIATTTAWTVLTVTLFLGAFSIIPLTAGGAWVVVGFKLLFFYLTLFSWVKSHKADQTADRIPRLFRY